MTLTTGESAVRVGLAELVIVWVESEAVDSKIQHYKVIDVVLGVVLSRGTCRVADAGLR